MAEGTGERGFGTEPEDEPLDTTSGTEPGLAGLAGQFGEDVSEATLGGAEGTGEGGLAGGAGDLGGGGDLGGDFGLLDEEEGERGPGDA